MTYHVVEFHADGGQMCVPGLRCFSDRDDADKFYKRMCSEPGHTCDPSSVRQYESHIRLDDFGIVYPGVANMGRNTLGECSFSRS